MMPTMKREWFRVGNFTGALAAGLPAPLVYFVAASAFERSPVGEIAGGMLFGSVYLAFAQFWVLPRRPVFHPAVWPTVLGALVPLAFCALLAGVLENPRTLWELGLPALGAGLAGGWLGAWLAGRLTKPVSPVPRTAANRRMLHVAGLSLLLVTAFVLLFHIVPVTQAGNTPGFNMSANVMIYRITAVSALLSAAILAVTARRAGAPAPKSLLGPVAIGTLLSGLIHIGMGTVSWHSPALLRAAWPLWGCAAADLVVAFLITLDSVLEDRRTCSPTCIERNR